jgi:hypothetical protein
MDRRDLVLAILGAADGAPYSPAQLQKAVFLVDRNLPGVVSEGPKFDFSPYDYGPFDRAVYGEAEQLSLAGLAEVRQSGNSRYRSYAITENGKDRASAVLDQLNGATADYIRRVSAWVRSLDFATLVKSIYNEYPEMRANSIFVG